ncbi:hypothetical protein [Rhodonellum sp.]|uniref:hypothetical protein n=1 Tax=Rhodonellum sp. TaxID=2231180 RepID=UPI002725D113|nr:hypothetical protein [Rhodonellum sp.]MDO9554245.1 hypothetical protein [Rhodonellum sp.]
MKKAFSILMLLTLLLPSFFRVGIFVHFKANQDFIAEVLCINKDEPLSECNGKCYLGKQLQKVEQNDGETNDFQPNPKTEEVRFTLFTSIQPKLTFWLLKMEKPQNPFLQNPTYNFLHSGGIFKPPQFLVV